MIKLFRDLWVMFPRLIRFHAIGSMVGIAVWVTAYVLSWPKPLRIVGLMVWFFNGLIVWKWIDGLNKLLEQYKSIRRP